MQKVKKYVIITAAAFLYAAGVSLFTDPNNMAPGGVTGIAIILSRILPVGTGTLLMLISHCKKCCINAAALRQTK